MEDNKYRTCCIYYHAVLPCVGDLLDILQREFPGATYEFTEDVITFANRDDLVIFILKYGHIYAPR